MLFHAIGKDIEELRLLMKYDTLQAMEAKTGQPHANAMIFAAGLGTRLQPLTLDIPKALVEVNGVSLLEILIRKLLRSGFTEIAINVHHHARKIRTFLHEHNYFNARIHLSDETDLLLDTGGGLKNAAPFLTGDYPFLLHNVDVLSSIDVKALWHFHLNSPGSLAVLAVNSRPSDRQFLVNESNTLCGWVNHVTGERIMAREETGLRQLSFCGIHSVSPRIFSLLEEEGVFSIINLYLRLAASETITLLPCDQDDWIDVGTSANLESASKDLDQYL